MNIPLLLLIFGTPRTMLLVEIFSIDQILPSTLVNVMAYLWRNYAQSQQGKYFDGWQPKSCSDQSSCGSGQVIQSLVKELIVERLEQKPVQQCYIINTMFLATRQFEFSQPRSSVESDGTVPDVLLWHEAADSSRDGRCKVVNFTVGVGRIL